MAFKKTEDTTLDTAKRCKFCGTSEGVTEEWEIGNDSGIACGKCFDEHFSGKRRMFLAPEPDDDPRIQCVADWVAKVQVHAIEIGIFDDHEDRRRWASEILESLDREKACECQNCHTKLHAGCGLPHITCSQCDSKVA